MLPPGALCALCGGGPTAAGGHLGPLLGPVPSVPGRPFVHRECALWSPEVCVCVCVCVCVWERGVCECGAATPLSVEPKPMPTPTYPSLSTQVYTTDDDALHNVPSALTRGARLACTHCGGRGATVGCRVRECAETYHLPCAATAGARLAPARCLVACPRHAPWYEGEAAADAAAPGGRAASPPPAAPRGARRAEVAAASRAAAVEAAARARAAAREAAAVDGADNNNSDDDAEGEARFRAREARRAARARAALAPIWLGAGSDDAAAAAAAGPPFVELAGAGAAVAALRSAVLLPLLHPRLLAATGNDPAPRGVLLTGPPGTGKTHAVRALARALAAACGGEGGRKPVPLYARKGADLLGKYAGDADRALRLLFEEAASAADASGGVAIIFLDEVDGLAPARSAAGGASAATHASAVATLLCLLDGAAPRGRVAVLAATNRPDAVDPALRRPGRFDCEAAFALPGRAARHAILNVHTRRWPVPPPPTLLASVAAATPGYAGADLAALATGAALAAARRCAPRLFDQDDRALPRAALARELGRVHVTAVDWAAALAAAPPPASARGEAGAGVTGSPLPRHAAPLLRAAAAAAAAALQAARVALPAGVVRAAQAQLASGGDGGSVAEALVEVEAGGGDENATADDDASSTFLPFDAPSLAAAVAAPPPPPCRLLIAGGAGATALGAALASAAGDAGGPPARFSPADASRSSPAAVLADAVAAAAARARAGGPGVLWLPDVDAWAVGRESDWRGSDDEEEEGEGDANPATATNTPSPLFDVLRAALADAPPGAVAVVASARERELPPGITSFFCTVVDAAPPPADAPAWQDVRSSVSETVLHAVVDATVAAARAAAGALRAAADPPPPPPTHATPTTHAAVRVEGHVQ